MHRYCKDEELLLLDFPEASKLQRSNLGNDLIFTEGAESFWTFRDKQLLFCLSSDAILLNTIDELGGEVGVIYFSREMGGKPVWITRICILKTCFLGLISIHRAQFYTCVLDNRVQFHLHK